MWNEGICIYGTSGIFNNFPQHLACIFRNLEFRLQTGMRHSHTIDIDVGFS